MKMWIIKIIIVIFFVNLTLNTALVHAATRVEPARIILYATSGDRKTGTIEVFNKGEEEINLRAILYDWTLDDKNALETKEAGTTETTLNNLIKFNPRQFKVEPGGKQIVRFTLSAPDEFKIERRGIVFFEEETDYTEKSTGAKIITQIGTAIYLVPTTVDSRFKLQWATIHIPENKDEEIVGLILAKNTGDAHVRFTVNYKIISEKGALITEDKLKEELILPGRQKGLGFPISNELTPGKYKMLLIIDFFGTDKKAEYSVPFEIK